jgi:hypothetical protein
MLANRLVSVAYGPVALLAVPVGIVTRGLGGFLVLVTFGLLLIPFWIVWVIFFMGLILGTSWLWDRMPLMRLPVALIGVPVAALGAVYTILVPWMTRESSDEKHFLCRAWPLSLDFKNRATIEDTVNRELEAAEPLASGLSGKEYYTKLMDSLSPEALQLYQRLQRLQAVLDEVGYRSPA